MSIAPGKFLYFVDAHEIKAFIDPDNAENLTGFMLHAEQIGHTDTAAPLSLELKLKNELVLRELLFDQTSQVGLLHCHGEEIDEEIAFRQFAWAHQQIALLDQARDQLNGLRSP